MQLSEHLLILNQHLILKILPEFCHQNNILYTLPSGIHVLLDSWRRPYNKPAASRERQKRTQLNIALINVNALTGSRAYIDNDGL